MKNTWSFTFPSVFSSLCFVSVGEIYGQFSNLWFSITRRYNFCLINSECHVDKRNEVCGLQAKHHFIFRLVTSTGPPPLPPILEVSRCKGVFHVYNSATIWIRNVISQSAILTVLRALRDVDEGHCLREVNSEVMPLSACPYFKWYRFVLKYTFLQWCARQLAAVDMFTVWQIYVLQAKVFIPVNAVASLRTGRPELDSRWGQNFFFYAFFRPALERMS
jgi:hypothetical protein